MSRIGSRASFNHNYMQKAIEKASKLIELLTKQNQQLKAEILKNIDQNQLIEELKESKKLLHHAHDELQEKQTKIKLITEQVNQLQFKFQEKSSKNKILHQKISDLQEKFQESQKNYQKQKKKNLTLENQNKYLLKNRIQSEYKQNQLYDYCELTKEQFFKELKQIERTKAAFSKKCQDLKRQNLELRTTITKLKSQNKSIQKKIEINEDNINLTKKVEDQTKQTNEALTYIIESVLKVKAETGLFSKAEQLKNYLTFRLQHIQNLIKPIVDLLQEKSIKHEGEYSKNLQQLCLMACRLSNYLNDLIK